MQAIILCGGKATRLGDLALDKPKSLIEVAGRPFIEWQLQKLAACGFDEVVLCTGHLGEQIERHVDQMKTMPFRKLSLSYEGVAPLGTAGALRNALKLLDHTFLVTYGDSYLPFDYAEPMRELVGNQDCDAVMSVWAEQPGNVRIDEARPGFLWHVLEKSDPHFPFIDYGAIAMTREVVERIPARLTIGLNRVLGGYARAGRIRDYLPPKGMPYHEIGSPEGLAETDAFLRGGGR